jgi:hypothetical protein
VALAMLCILAGCANGGDETSEESADPPPSTSSTPTAETTTTTIEIPPSDGVIAGAIDEQDLGEPYIGELAFVAPLNCSVPVSETILEAGSTVRLEYIVVFTDEGETVSFGDSGMLAVELDGEPVTESEQSRLGNLHEIPTFVMADDGGLEDIRIVEFLDNMAAMQPSLTGLSAEPGFVDLIADLFQDKYWTPWYGFWINWGQIAERVETTPLMVSATASVPAAVTSLGTTEHGLAAVRAEFSLADEPARANLRELFADWIPGEATPEERDRIIAGTKVQIDRTLESVLDPHTLRPHSVWSRRDVSMTVDGQTTQVEEERSTTFDWAASDCT